MVMLIACTCTVHVQYMCVLGRLSVWIIYLLSFPDSGQRQVTIVISLYPMGSCCTHTFDSLDCHYLWLIVVLWPHQMSFVDHTKLSCTTSTVA